jgi:hypothetical protein
MTETKQIYESPDKGKTITSRDMNSPAPPPPADLLSEWHNTTYEKQRRSRLSDVVCDYLDDDDLAPSALATDLLKEIEEWANYHKAHYEKADVCIRVLRHSLSSVSRVE